MGYRLAARAQGFESYLLWAGSKASAIEAVYRCRFIWEMQRI
jgi:hypothetical protein